MNMVAFPINGDYRAFTSMMIIVGICTKGVKKTYRIIGLSEEES